MSVHRSYAVVPVVLLVHSSMLFVSLDVEVREENDEGDHITDLEIQPAHWETAWPNHSTGCLDHGHNKLDQLSLCYILLPPEVRSYGGNS